MCAVPVPEGVESPRAGLSDVIRFPTWVLGTEHRSSANTVCAFTAGLLFQPQLAPYFTSDLHSSCGPQPVM